MNNQLVTVKVFMTEIDAELARGRLASEGIEAFIFKDDCGGMYPALRLSGGVAVKVPAGQAARAAEVLGPPDEPLEGASGDVPAGENLAALLSILAWMAGICGAGLLLLGFFDAALLRVGLPLLLVAFILAYLSRQD